jgi:uncharacterized membrane protein SpoIIM required for sporulation
MNILLGLIIIASGVGILRFRYQIYQFTGDWDWAIKYLWGNGTVVAIVLIWMLLIGAGTAYPFWVFEGMNDPIVITPNGQQ